MLDAKTNKPVPDAGVVVKDYSGNAVSNLASARNTKGEADLKIDFKELNKSLRVIAQSPGYEEKWSDLPAEFKQRIDEQKYFQVYLKKKGAAKQGEEKKYGPYSVPPGKWVSTGLTLKKGQSFRVEASGTWKYTEGTKAEFGPEGGGYWTWWTLKGKIGDQLINVGRNGGGSLNQDGMLELGAPATYTMGHGEEKILEGSYTVFVYSKDAEQTQPDKTTPNTVPVKVSKFLIEMILRR